MSVVNENEPSLMQKRPPIREIVYITPEGNSAVFRVDNYGVTEIKEVAENGEYCLIPWVEVWIGSELRMRINQHKLEHILYGRRER